MVQATETLLDTATGLQLNNSFTAAGGWVTQFDSSFSRSSQLDVVEDPDANLRTVTSASVLAVSSGAYPRENFTSWVVCAATSWIVPPPAADA